LRLRFDDDLRLRGADWDEPSDWPGFVDFIEWGEEGSTPRARIGRLHNARLGHGTLLDHYQTTIDVDSNKVGVEAELTLGSMGIEAVANDVVTWEVLGARIWLDPFLGGLP